MNEVQKIINNYTLDEKSVIPILQEIQQKYKYLPKDVLLFVASKVGISPANIYSVATFYENFSLEPKGEYVVKVCDGTACHIKKSFPILNSIKTELSLGKNEKTTKDMLFTIETVACLGTCGLAPVMTINEKVHHSLTKEAAVAIIKEISKKISKEDEKDAGC